MRLFEDLSEPSRLGNLRRHAKEGAEPNASTRKPTDSNRLVSPQRIDSSSPMTKTIGTSAPASSRSDLGGSVTARFLTQG
jgi:hypothetical protein